MAGGKERTRPVQTKKERRFRSALELYRQRAAICCLSSVRFRKLYVFRDLQNGGDFIDCEQVRTCRLPVQISEVSRRRGGDADTAQPIALEADGIVEFERWHQ